MILLYHQGQEPLSQRVQKNLKVEELLGAELEYWGLPISYKKY